MYKLLRSPLFYIGIVGVVSLCCTNFFNYGFSHGDVVSHINAFFGIGVYRKSMTVFAALPFAANFADEWINGVTVNCAVRKGIRKYAVANMLFCAISALLTVFVGMMIFSGLYSLFVPIYEYDGNPYSVIFGQFLRNGQGWIFLILKILVFSFSCAMWAALGMLLSALFPNKYVALCAPFVASYIVERFTIQFPDDLNLWYLSLSLVYFDNDLFGFLYCTGIFAAITALYGIGFVVLVQRRVRNELT